MKKIWAKQNMLKSLSQFGCTLKIMIPKMMLELSTLKNHFE